MSRRLVISFVVVASAIAGLLVHRFRPARETSPVQAAIGRPFDDYVGRDVCAECHLEQARHFSGTGHARTFSAAAASPVARRLIEVGFSDLERDREYRYEESGNGLAVALTSSSSDVPFPLQYAVGSGDHAVTFLSLLPSADGDITGVEHRVSWYGHSDSPGLTPGHAGRIAQDEYEEFGLVKRGTDLSGCIVCHTTTASIEGIEVTNLRSGVGCEVCHGPGRDHVTAIEAGEEHRNLLYADDSHQVDQIRHCGRCHRTVVDVPPNRIRRDETVIVRFQPVGLAQSRCYTQSNGALSCTTCHNPHEHSSRTTRRQYDNQCMACHNPASPDSTACPVSERRDCIQCHMPIVEFYNGIGFHDHWIRVRTNDDPPRMEPISVASKRRLDDR